MADDRGGRVGRSVEELIAATAPPTLYLLRHAKSAWPDGVDDFDRPLAPRGERAAALVGRFLAAVDEAPDLVLASNARRARDTADRAATAGGWSADLRVVPELYGATATDTIEVIGRLGASAARLLVVGHEPAMGHSVGALCGRLQLRFPTAALARIDLGVGRWAEVTAGAGELRWLVPPRLLRAAGLR